MTRSRALPSLVLCLAVAACAKKDKSIADTTSTPVAPVTSTAAAGGTTAAAGSIALADVAGTWKMHSVPTSGTDRTPTDYTLTATGEAGGWKVVYANGLTQVPQVTASGDSIVLDIGPHASVRRKAVQVTTHGVLRRQGDKLAGTIVAHYLNAGADSVLTLQVEGTRVK